MVIVTKSPVRLDLYLACSSAVVVVSSISVIVSVVYAVQDGSLVKSEDPVCVALYS